jgi:hypothetical protein
LDNRPSPPGYLLCFVTIAVNNLLANFGKVLTTILNKIQSRGHRVVFLERTWGCLDIAQQEICWKLFFSIFDTDRALFWNIVQSSLLAQLITRPSLS